MDIHYDETSPTFLRWGKTASPKVREMRRELHGEFARD